MTPLSQRDDVVVQGPEPYSAVLPIFHSQTACAGAAMSYLMRRIAYRAGAYAPGIQDVLFHQLHSARHGAEITRVQSWLDGALPGLNQLGYRLQYRWCVQAAPTLATWVKQGRGFRGAVVPTTYRVLHPRSLGAPADHAVGMILDRSRPGADEEMLMIDPWPGKSGLDRAPLSPQLEAAHREHKYWGLMCYWVGWS